VQERVKKSKTETLRAAVVGVGYLGRFHAEKYAAMKGVDLVAVVDKNPKRAREVAGITGAVPYGDASEIGSIVDMASVAVPTSSHHEVAGQLLRQGVDVLIEKPMTETTSQATDLIRLAERKGCILQVGHLERFNAVWDVAGPALKDPKFIEAHRLAFFQDRGTDVDVVLDLMIHDIDIMLKYVPSPVSRVDSVGVPVLTSNIDIANVRLHFENGTVANLTASRVSAKKTRKIRFFQEDLYVSVDYDARKAQIVRKVRDGRSKRFRIEGEEKTLPEMDALNTELVAFRDCVRTRKQPEVDGVQGKKALQVALRILRRMRSS